MVQLYYIIIAPSSLSIIGCLIFLYLYCKHLSIRLAFGMKHVACLQLFDLFLALSNLIPIHIIADKLSFCYVIAIVFLISFLFQTYWIAVLSNYIYQVMYKGKEKDSISIIKPLIVGFLISLPSPILILSFDCVKCKYGVCSFGCNIIVFVLIVFMNHSIIFSSLLYSTITNYRSIKKLYSDSRGSIYNQRSSLARLLIYPFITIICILPGSIRVLHNSDYNSNGTYDIVCMCMASSIGFFNSITLGFTPEVKEALKLDNDLKRQELVNLMR